MLPNPPLGLIKAILYGMTDPGKPFQIRGLKAEKARVGSCLDNQRIFQINHMRSPSAGGDVQLAPEMPAGPDRRERSSAADCHAR